MNNFRVARENWAKNHRHQGGLGALLRCWRGQRALAAGSFPRPDAPPGELEVLTFSVVPWLTALWARAFEPALAAHDSRLLVADSSGGFRGPWRDFLGRVPLRVLPCLNHHHGEKLDLFFTEVCRGELVLICDDDIFFPPVEAGSGPAPLEWAVERFAEDPGLAVVSLAPRTLVSSVLQGRLEEPMGSSCILVRRSLWLREGLSFRMAPAPEGQGSDWFYDTGDLANVELLRRGHRVLVAPPRIRAGLVPLEAISAWVLKAQKHPPRRLAQIADLPVRRTKALRALTTARGLAGLAARRVPGGGPTLAEALPRLDEAASAVAARVEAPERERLEAEVEVDLARIEDILEEDPQDDGS